MTKQRKKRLCEKIQQSRSRLMDTHPFFAILLMYLKYVSDPETKTISTNGRCIYFSADYLDKLYPYELDFILCHQIMHIISGHIWRPIDRADDDYHFACDINANSQLSALGYSEERYPHIGNIYANIPGINTDPSTLSPDKISALLPYSLYSFNEQTRRKFLIDSDIWWDMKNDNGESCEIIIDLPEIEGNSQKGGDIGREGDGNAKGISLSATDDNNIPSEWNARVAMAANVASKSKKSEGENKGNDNIPDFAKRMIQKQPEPLIDWKKILNNFLQEQINDYSFSPPDKRYSDSDLFLPDFNEKDYLPKDILFMVDTSGSINDDNLSTVYSEIRGAIEQFNGKILGQLGFFDCNVTEPIPFTSVDDLIKIIPYGGGGTDFFVIFDYIRQKRSNDLPASIVIFTDGFAAFPNESEAMGIPTLWIINNEESSPPFGTVIRLLTKDSFE